MTDKALIHLADVMNDAAKFEPMNVMHKIIAALRDETKLKDRSGMLKSNYPGDQNGYFTDDSLWFDVATLADVATYRVTIHGATTERRAIDTAAVLQAVSEIDADKANGKFKELVSEVRSLRDRLDGRQTDHDDIHNFNIRRGLVKKYAESIKPDWVSEEVWPDGTFKIWIAHNIAVRMEEMMVAGDIPEAVVVRHGKQAILQTLITHIASNKGRGIFDYRGSMHDIDFSDGVVNDVVQGIDWNDIQALKFEEKKLSFSPRLIAA